MTNLTEAWLRVHHQLDDELKIVIFFPVKKKNFINIDLKHLMFTDFFIMLSSLFNSLMQKVKKEYLNCLVLEQIPIILFKSEDLVI